MEGLLLGDLVLPCSVFLQKQAAEVLSGLYTASSCLALQPEGPLVEMYLHS